MATSFHYRNLAVDIRTNDLPSGRIVEFHKDISELLGKVYDVILEKDHIHIEPSKESKYGQV